MTTLKHKIVNKISRLKVNNVITEDDEDIKREAMRFFSCLLEREHNLDKEKQKEFLRCIPKSISKDQNKDFTIIPSK